MRIISVVTLVTPDGAYGGPVRVAVNQAAALIAAGHEVTVAAASMGFSDPPSQIDGVPVRLFPARRILPRTGFAGLASPGLQRWLRRELVGADVVHVHAARDLITLPAAAQARRAGVPYFLQTHGMIDPSGHPLAAPLDAAMTRPVLRSAAGVFFLTERERRDLTAVAGEPLPLIELPNGVPEGDYQPPQPPPEVLYLARLAPRKRPLFFVAAARELHQRFPEAIFSLVGPDEGEGAAVAAAAAEARAMGVPVEWSGGLAPEQTSRRLSLAAISVLPSVDEPYPMSVLEALSVGRPVVITDSCGLAGFVRRHGAGIVADHTQASLTAAIATLLADLPAADAAGQAGRQAVRDELSMAAIAAQLTARYRAALPS